MSEMTTEQFEQIKAALSEYDNKARAAKEIYEEALAIAERNRIQALETLTGQTFTPELLAWLEYEAYKHPALPHHNFNGLWIDDGS